MRSSDAHLERALEEYNDKVNGLEADGDTKELLDAYVNRGCVLSMMGNTVSAIEDFDDAISIIRKLEDSGNTVDAGYFVKVYVSRGELQTDSTAKNMADDYRMAASKLSQLVPGSKYYDEKDILEMCVVCAGDLIDNGFQDDSKPFTDKGLSMLVGKDDDVSRNYYVELCNLQGQALMDDEDNSEAYDSFSESVRVGRILASEGKLSDEMDLVYAYVSKGDMDELLEKEEEFFEDRETAIQLMEDLKLLGKLDDEELLSNLHGEIAQAYMKKGKMEEAEKHLMKQVSYNLHGSTEYLKDNDYEE